MDWPDVVYEDILDAEVIDVPEGYERISLCGFPIRVSDEVADNEMRLIDRDGNLIWQMFFDSEEQFNTFMDKAERGED